MPIGLHAPLTHKHTQTHSKLFTSEVLPRSKASWLDTSNIIRALVQDTANLHPSVYYVVVCHGFTLEDVLVIRAVGVEFSWVQRAKSNGRKLSPAMHHVYGSDR